MLDPDPPADDPTEGVRAVPHSGRDGERLGCGGGEHRGGDAALRSVVVLPGLRGRGLGRQVTEAVLREAAGPGARRAWLRTPTAAPFLERLGFIRYDRTAAPQSIRSTRQAAGLCPSSAALMVRSLAP